MAKLIAAYSSHLPFWDYIIFCLPAQVTWSSFLVPSCLTASGIRERCGALLFVRRKLSAAIANVVFIFVVLHS